MSIEQELRDAGSDTVLQRPLADVLARGEHLRRRRARRRMVGATGVLACAVVGGSLALGPGRSPLVAPAVASFSGPRTNLGAEELAELNRACLGQGDVGIPRDQAPIAAEEREGRYLAYYRHGTANGACSAQAAGDRRIRVTGMGSGTSAQPLTGDDALALVILGYAESGNGAERVHDLHAVAETSDAVRRVTLQVGSETFEGTVASGAAFFWVTDRRFTEAEAGSATITAYDADGRVLGRA